MRWKKGARRMKKGIGFSLLLPLCTAVLKPYLKFTANEQGSKNEVVNYSIINTIRSKLAL